MVYGDAGWERLCTLPCERELPVGGEYRVSGDGVRASRKFQTDGHAGPHLNLRAEAGGAPAGYIGGIVTSSVGGAAILVGLVLSLTAATCNDGSDCSAPASSGEGVAGLAIAGAGVAAVITGVVLMVSNTRSEITDEVRAWFPAASRGTSIESGAAATASGRFAMPGAPGSMSAVTIPLLAHSF